MMNCLEVWAPRLAHKLTWIVYNVGCILVRYINLGWYIEASTRGLLLTSFIGEVESISIGKRLGRVNSMFASSCNTCFLWHGWMPCFDSTILWISQEILEITFNL